jgi:hypothetical protein
MRILTNSEQAENPFEAKLFRTVWSEDVWLYSAIDICAILTNREYQAARKYWKNYKYELEKAMGQLVRISYRLNFYAADKKQRFTDVLDTMQVLFLLQVIPSKNANPYRLWLAECAAAGDNVAEKLEKLAEKNAGLTSEEVQDGLLKRQTITRRKL